MSLRVKNWSRYQHYRDRNPPWIKLHFSMLSSADWVGLDDASRVLAIVCMLLASRNGGAVPDNVDYIKRVAYLNRAPNFKPLIECGFLENASGLEQKIQDAIPETERETEREKTLSGKPDVLALKESAKQILGFLNTKTGRAYQSVPANLEFIEARLKDGATEAQCRQVIAKKCREWGADEKMAEFLRPATLFNRTKFAQYQGELVLPKGAA